MRQHPYRPCELFKIIERDVPTLQFNLRDERPVHGRAVSQFLLAPMQGRSKRYEVTREHCTCTYCTSARTRF